MNQRKFLAYTRLLLALLGASAVVTQFVHGLHQPSFGLVNFFSFFTIESNILAVIVLSVAAVYGLRGARYPSDFLRGAATLYMATTGMIYVLLLAGLEASLQTPIPWVNAVLHYIMPLAVCADWLIDRVTTLTYKKMLWWLIFPLLYVAYSLIRGYHTGWYPYPFLNPAKHGYLFVAEMSAMIAVAIIALALLVTWYGRRPARKKIR